MVKMQEDELKQSASESEEEGSEESFELPDALATGREKRQTAGNRLRDMLNAELESEAIFAEDAEDVDFGSDQDQQDDLDSELDSDSSDDQPAVEPEDAGELQLQKQEKELARARKRKAAEAFNKVKPVNRAASRQVQRTTTGKASPQPRQVAQRNLEVKRQSRRAHAVEIAGAVEQRLTAEADKRAKMNKSAKIEERPLTQAERLEEAKLTEAKNIASLNQIVKYEEDKKANQKLLAARRKAIGPFIRFVSTSRTTDAPSESYQTALTNQTSTSNAQTASLVHPLDAMTSVVAADVTPALEIPAQKAPEAFGPKVGQVKHFLSLQNLGDAESRDPKSILQAVFGEAPKSKPIPPSQASTCSLSGLPAIYRDPETSIPYGSLWAYHTLQDLKTGTIPWNPQLKMYVPRSTL